MQALHCVNPLAELKRLSDRMSGRANILQQLLPVGALPFSEGMIFKLFGLNFDGW